MENNRRGSGIFLGVIGVATLVVAIIGATFAYFSASAGGANFVTNSTSVSLGFEELTDQIVLKTSLIPAYDNIAKLGEGSDNAAKNGRCVDDNKNDICSVYTFMVGNPSTTTTTKVTATLNVVTNGFENLYFRIYDITDGKETQVVGPTNLLQNAPTSIEVDGQTFQIPVSYDAGVTFSNEGKTLTLAPLSIHLAPSKTAPTDMNDASTYVANEDGSTNYRIYKVLVWLRDTGSVQPNDTNDSFSASINFSTGTGSGVTGVLAGAGGVPTEGKNDIATEQD